ncbi:hypothetical protein [Micromonospora sp. NPDC023644]|uniref:hypothetical protein n=1 Tax=Micromonospora sp. NPDC023644 TaxID=3154321 RepID=UPI0033EB19D6
MTTADPLSDRRGRYRAAWHGLHRRRGVRPLRGGSLTGPRPYVVPPVLLGLFAAVALAAPGPTPVHGAALPTPACPTTAPGQGGTRPAPSGTPLAPTGTPSATPAPSAPGPSPSAGGGTVVLDDLLGDGRDDDEEADSRATPSATPTAHPTATLGVRPTASPTPRPKATPGVRPTATATPGVRPTATATPTVRPTATGRPAAPGPPCAPASPTPSRPGPVATGGPLPRIDPDPGQPVVAPVPSLLTGSQVTMTGLRFEGVVDLPTADGSLRALKFTMEQAVTDDFLLRSPGPAGTTMRFATDRLTVRGDVAFYATRFVGRLLGVKITLTPDLPLPDGLPITSPVPVTFTDPAMELAFVRSGTLTAQPALKLTLS